MVWWQDFLVRTIGVMLVLVIPLVLFGARGLVLLFAAPFLVLPAIRLAAFLFFSVIPPRFTLKPDAIITLFKR